MEQDEVIMPIWDYCILELDKDSGSKIVLPEGADPAANVKGTFQLVVVFTGPDCVNIKPGDRLVCNPQALVPFSNEGQAYYLISERATGVIKGKLRQMRKAPDGRLPQ